MCFIALIPQLFQTVIGYNSYKQCFSHLFFSLEDHKKTSTPVVLMNTNKNSLYLLLNICLKLLMKNIILDKCTDGRMHGHMDTQTTGEGKTNTKCKLIILLFVLDNLVKAKC